MPANNGRPWTAEEDSLLIQAISVHGENEKWQAVALSVPGRTNKACRKRWLHSLSPSVKKTPWTTEEDRALLSLYAIHCTKWSVIARHIPGRTDDACSKRYREALDPNLRKDEWTHEEDTRLLDSYARLGGRWGQIGQEMQRSGLGCRNRWRMIERKKAAVLRKGPGHSGANLGFNEPTEQGEDLPEWSDISMYQEPSFWPMNTSYQDTADVPLVSGRSLVSVPTASHTFARMGAGSSTLALIAVNATLPYQPTPPSLGPALLPSTSPTHSMLPSLSHPFHNHDHWDSSNHGFPNGGDRDPSSNEREVGYTMVQTPSPEVDISFVERQHDDVPLAPISSEVGTQGSSTSSSPIHEPSGDMHVTPSNSASLRATVLPDIPARRSEAISITPGSSSSIPASSSIPTHIQSCGEHAISSADSSSTEVPPSLQATVTHRFCETSPYYRPGYRVQPKAPGSSNRSGQTSAPLRLSATLVVSDDPTMLPYTCGYPACWPADAVVSAARYATSQELSDHSKAEHEGELVLDSGKPFRCGLEGCGKGWKSVNGLQYHLQISKAHFRQALSASMRRHDAEKQQPPATSPADATGAQDSTEDSSELTKPKAKKKFPCPHPECSNEYKQLSGLRYHLSHGHSHDLPTQLDIVPPALARKVAAKASASLSLPSS